MNIEGDNRDLFNFLVRTENYSEKFGSIEFLLNEKEIEDKIYLLMKTGRVKNNEVLPIAYFLFDISPGVGKTYNNYI